MGGWRGKSKKQEDKASDWGWGWNSSWREERRLPYRAEDSEVGAFPGTGDKPQRILLKCL